MDGDLGHVVVVLSWNGRRDTVECVESIRSGSPEADVLVVDNGSYDGVIEAVEERWPEVHTLQTGANRGFAGGMNAGLGWALDRGARTITVLNNDTVIPPGALAALDAAAGPDLALSPVVVYRADPGRIWFGGGVLEPPEAFPRHAADHELDPCVGGLRSTALLAGCCITASATVWARVGGFDVRYFLNFEDSEWSVRARRSGVRLAVLCDVRIQHAVSASFVGAAATLGSFYYIRNGLMFGRTAGGGLRAGALFLRRRALGGLRSRGRRDAARALVVCAVAVAAFASRRYGPAPAWLARTAERWSRPRG